MKLCQRGAIERRMRLLSVTLVSYRRFANETSVRLDEHVIALVGPNESGKSSLLRALTLMNDDDPLPISDRTRLSAEPARITVRFQVDDEDRALLAEIPECRELLHFEISKSEAAGRTQTLIPFPRRDLAPRRQMQEFLTRFLDKVRPAGPAAEWPDTTRSLIERVGAFVEFLKSDTETLDPGTIAEISALAEALDALPRVLDTPMTEDAAERLRNLHARESEKPPSVRAERMLRARLPVFALFDDASRTLSSEYDLNVLLDNLPPPQSVLNLAALGGLDLTQLRDAMRSGIYGRAEHLVEQANVRLKQAFLASWKQSDVTVRLSRDAATLRLLVSLPGDQGYSPLHERSDGLRWFVALRAFLQRQENVKPILLVDEAETHLHYDAQADLVQVLETQELAASVIYTTHSVGCLPSDLGSGIRLIVATNDEHCSGFENSFWSSGPGLTPLLFGMGARMLAFTAVRYGVLTEGPSECILLPTLLGKLTPGAPPNYRVVPGLSVVTSDEVRDLRVAAVRVAFLVDGDAGGDAIIADKLEPAGVREEEIVRLLDDDGGGLTLEDLVEESVFATAVDAELRRWQTVPATITGEDVRQRPRMRSVELWCRQRNLKPPSKIAIAQRIVDQRAKSSLLDQSLRPALLNAHNRILGILRPPHRNDAESDLKGR